MDYFFIPKMDEVEDEAVYITLNEFISKGYRNRGLGTNLEILDKYKYTNDYWDVLYYYGYD